MKYFLHDLICETQRQFSCKEALIAHLYKTFFSPASRQSPDSFLSNVNVTGKDMVSGYDFNCWKEIFELRRWLVTDEDGRHIDVRAWANEIRAYQLEHKKEQLPEFRCEPALEGHKQHAHYMRGPAFYHQSLKTLDDHVAEALEYAEPKAIHFGSSNKMDFWDHVSYFDERRGAKSWKEQKGWRQWQKHFPERKRCRRQSQKEQVLNHWQEEEAILLDAEQSETPPIFFSPEDFLEGISDPFEKMPVSA